MSNKISITIPGADFSATGIVSQDIYDPITALGTDLMAFFDAEDASTITVASGKVTSWASRVGSLTLSNYDAAYKPDYLVDGWGTGIPAVDFSAGAGVTGTVLTNTSGPVNDAGMSVFAVVKRGTQLDGSSSSMRPVMQLPVALKSAVRQQGLLGVWRPTTSPTQDYATAGQFTGSSFSSNSNVQGFASGGKGLLYGEFPNTDAIKARLNGGLPGPTKIYYDVANASTWSMGGQRNVADESFDGSVFMVLVVKGVPSDAVRQKIEGYCMWRAGIEAQLPIAHPYYRDGPYV